MRLSLGFENNFKLTQKRILHYRSEEMSLGHQENNLLFLSIVIFLFLLKYILQKEGSFCILFLE